MSGTAPTYDDNGNLTSYGARSYIYSAENQLLEATTLSGGTVQYSYGPGARRVRKNVNGTVTSFIHAGGMEIAEYDGSGNILRRYIPGPGVDQRIAMIDCGTSANCAANELNTDTQYYFADRLGNVLAVTDNTGDIVQQFFYTPFGVEMVGDASGNPFRYTGRKYDPETGLYYYRARYYDADLGRFLQVDPIGYEDQWNLYSYVGNNPLNGTDLSGLQEALPRSSASLRLDAISAQGMVPPAVRIVTIHFYTAAERNEILSTLNGTAGQGTGMLLDVASAAGDLGVQGVDAAGRASLALSAGTQGAELYFALRRGADLQTAVIAESFELAGGLAGGIVGGLGGGLFAAALCTTGAGCPIGIAGGMLIGGGIGSYYGGQELEYYVPPELDYVGSLDGYLAADGSFHQNRNDAAAVSAACAGQCNAAERSANMYRRLAAAAEDEGR